MAINLCVETRQIIQHQMYQISLGNGNTSDMKMISSLSIELGFIFDYM